MKIHKRKNAYIRSFFDILLDIFFIIILLTIVFAIYKLIYCILQKIPDITSLYGSILSASVTVILAFISYISKLRKYIPILLHKFKQQVYQFFALTYNPFSVFTIIDYNKNHLLETDDQGEFISSAIHILKDNTQSMILISGFAGRGKTTSVMLLLSAIACDRELYWMFSELQNRIIYFDSVNDKEALLDYLGHVGKPKCKLIIIDNIQKYTISSINEIMSRVNNFVMHNQTTEKKALIVFLYQETSKNEALYEYVRNKFFKNKNNIFELNQYVNFVEDNNLCSSNLFLINPTVNLVA